MKAIQESTKRSAAISRALALLAMAALILALAIVEVMAGTDGAPARESSGIGRKP